VVEALDEAADVAGARRNARLYLTGITGSFVGGSAMILAAGIWVKSLTGSSSLAALVSVCVYAPSLFGPLAGLLADRVHCRRLLVTVNLMTAGILLPLLAVRSPDELWLIFVVMTWYGAALALIDPAEQALFVMMLPTEERQRVNGLRMSLQEGAKLVAPLAGAGLYSLLGGGAVAAFSATTFLIAGLVISRLQVSEPPRNPPSEPWLDQVSAGFRHLGRTKVLLIVTLSAATAMAASGVLVAATFELVDAVGRAPSFLGVITATLGAGSIAAGILSSRLVRRFGEARLLLLGLADSVIGYLLLAPGVLPAVLIGSFVLGFALPWIVIAVINLGQRLTPLHLQGRVAAVTALLLFAPQPFAHLAGAAAIAALDYWVLYLAVAGLALLNLTVVGVLLRQLPTGASR
jgi:Na+/melibiose symporter-like transporter